MPLWVINVYICLRVHSGIALIRAYQGKSECGRPRVSLSEFQGITLIKWIILWVHFLGTDYKPYTAVLPFFFGAPDPGRTREIRT